MPYKMVSPTVAHLDVFVSALESPTGKPLRIRKRVHNTTEALAKKLEAQIDAALRTTGQWAPDAPPATEETTTASRSIGAALRLAFEDPEDGWRNTRRGEASFKLAKEAVDLLGAHLSCGKVDRASFASLRKTFEAKGNSERTIQSKLQALYRVLYFAEREGWIKQRPKFKRPRLSNARLFTYSPEVEAQVVSYFEAIGQHDMAIAFALGIDTGMRLSEILTLEGSRVDLAAGLVLIPDVLAKNGTFRQVVVLERSLARLRHLVGLYGKHRLFPALTPKKVSDLMIAAREFAGEADNAEFVFHATRHTHLSRLAAKEVPLQVIMDQAGHKTAAMSMRYIHMTARERQRIIMGADK